MRRVSVLATKSTALCAQSKAQQAATSPHEIDGALCSIEGATGCDIAAVRAALDNTIGECYGSERETLADIVADLRGRADCAERHRREFEEEENEQ